MRIKEWTININDADDDDNNGLCVTTLAKRTGT